MPVIYVLKLNGGKYYIGKTTNPDCRFEQHETGKGSAWTKLYEPLEIIDTIIQDMRFTELAITLKYMKKYGIDNVRGSTYSNVQLTKSQKEEIERHIRGEYDLCLTCGDDSHFMELCPANQQTFLQRLQKWFCCVKKTNALDYNLINDEIIQFGKYNGCTYEEVYHNDSGYCNWVKNTNSDREEFNRFKRWLISQ
jgi:predicted GIY-YIG superfamily endonuclease